MKFRVLFTAICVFMLLISAAVQAEESLGNVKVGGNLKMYLYDQSVGTSKDVQQHNNNSAGLTTFYLFLSEQLTDLVSVEVWPRFSVSASATPSLGNDIARTTTATTTVSVYQAFVKVNLPQAVEVKAGKMVTFFSNEYGREIWWDEQYHLNPGIATLQSWDDYGLEIYKNFDFEKVSLPVYLYLLNGEKTDVDNNNSKAAMVHFDPEFLEGKVKLVGSYGFGKWDDGSDKTFVRYDAGVEYKYQKINVRSEYLSKTYSDKLVSGAQTKDAVSNGYFVKALYRFTPEWRALIGYSRALNSATYTYSDIYKTTTMGVDYFITESSTIIAQYSMVDANRTNDSAALNYNRFTLGWRTTF